MNELDRPRRGPLPSDERPSADIPQSGAAAGMERREAAGMPNRLFVTASALLALLSGTALGARDRVNSPPAAPATDASLRAMQALLDDYVKTGKVTGIVAA